MKIGIEVNGVLRDTITKILQVYEKWYIDNPLIEKKEGDFEYAIISDITSLNLSQHLKFQNEDEVYDFLYTEHCMEIFAHSPSVEMSTFVDFNDFYVENRDQHEILIVSDEIGKSKPATLFFLSKFGCQVEKVKFYSKITIDSMWDEVDVLLTASPDLLLNHPENKKVIKFESPYNTEIQKEVTIKEFKDLNETIKKLNVTSSQ
jgi:hypothetical protein